MLVKLSVVNWIILRKNIFHKTKWMNLSDNSNEVLKSFLIGYLSSS